MENIAVRFRTDASVRLKSEGTSPADRVLRTRRFVPMPTAERATVPFDPRRKVTSVTRIPLEDTSLLRRNGATCEL